MNMTPDELSSFFANMNKEPEQTTPTDTQSSEATDATAADIDNGSEQTQADNTAAPVDNTPQPETPPEPEVAQPVVNEADRAMLIKLAQAQGMKFRDYDDLMQQLNDKALEEEAARAGVPKEYLARMEKLEADAAKWQAAEAQRQLTQQFASLQTKYQLSQEELIQFATNLDKSGFKLGDNIDVEGVYLRENMDKIVERRVQVAVQEALKRDEQANAQSATPNSLQGGAAAAISGGVKTSADLHRILGIK